MIPLLLPDPPLADGRVILRPLADGDVAAIVEGCRDPLVQRFTRVPADYSEDDARAFIGGAPGRRANGVSLESLGVPRLDGSPVEKDQRAIWRLFAAHYHLFRGTPSAAFAA